MRPLAAFLYTTGDAMAAAKCAPVVNVRSLAVRHDIRSAVAFYLYVSLCGACRETLDGLNVSFF